MIETYEKGLEKLILAQIRQI